MNAITHDVINARHLHHRGRRTISLSTAVLIDLLAPGADDSEALSYDRDASMAWMNLLGNIEEALRIEMSLLDSGLQADFGDHLPVAIDDADQLRALSQVLASRLGEVPHQPLHGLYVDDLLTCADILLGRRRLTAW
jgi:hypothetical protein